MTENEIWDAKWVALKLVLAGRTFYHYRKNPLIEGTGVGFTAKRILTALLVSPASDIAKDSALKNAIEWAGFTMDP